MKLSGRIGNGRDSFHPGYGGGLGWDFGAVADSLWQLADRAAVMGHESFMRGIKEEEEEVR